MKPEITRDEYKLEKQRRTQIWDEEDNDLKLTKTQNKITLN